MMNAHCLRLMMDGGHRPAELWVIHGVTIHVCNAEALKLLFMAHKSQPADLVPEKAHVCHIIIETEALNRCHVCDEERPALSPM